MNAPDQCYFAGKCKRTCNPTSSSSRKKKKVIDFEELKRVTVEENEDLFRLDFKKYPPCRKEDHVNKTNCAENPTCLYGLGENDQGIWAAHPPMLDRLGIAFLRTLKAEDNPTQSDLSQWQMDVGADKPPGAPPDVCATRKENQKLNEEIMVYNSDKTKLLNAIEERKRMYKKFFNTDDNPNNPNHAVVFEAGLHFYWVETEWLQSWIVGQQTEASKNASDSTMINNLEQVEQDGKGNDGTHDFTGQPTLFNKKMMHKKFLCCHGKLSPESVPNLKRIRVMAYWKLREQYGTDTDLYVLDHCNECLREYSKKRLSAVQHQIMIEELKQSKRQKEARELICNQKAEIAEAKGKLQKCEAALKKKERDDAESKQVIAQLRIESNNAKTEVKKLKSELADKKDVFKVLKELTCKEAIRNMEREQLSVLQSSLEKTMQTVSEVKREHAEEREREFLCCICMDCPKKVLVMPCKHLCICESCAQQTLDYCPMCRIQVETTITVFS